MSEHSAMMADIGSRARAAAAELAFAALAVAVFVGQRLADGVLGVTKEFRAESAETLGTKQNALAARAAGRGIGGTWHLLFSV